MFELDSREEGVLSRHPRFVEALAAYARAVRDGRAPATLALVPMAARPHAAEESSAAGRAGQREPVARP